MCNQIVHSAGELAAFGGLFFERNSCEQLPKQPPVIVELLGPLPSRSKDKIEAPSSVVRDDPYVPNGTHRSVQTQKGGGCPRLEISA